MHMIHAHDQPAATFLLRRWAHQSCRRKLTRRTGSKAKISSSAKNVTNSEGFLVEEASSGDYFDVWRVSGVPIFTQTEWVPSGKLLKIAIYSGFTH